MLGACNKPYYQGPVSDHFDGKQFSAPEKIEKKNWLAVARWRLTSQRKKWPEWVDYMPDTPPDHVSGEGLRASFVNHATVLLQTQGMNILTDPIWSQRCSPFSFIGPKRVTAPGIGWDSLPKIDVVLISHSHYDHLDLPTVKRLAEQDHPLFIVPLGVDTIIRDAVPGARIQAMDWHQAVKVNDHLTVHAEPTQHWSARTPFDDNKALWASYVLETPQDKIYFSGDTGYASGQVFRDIGKKYGGFRFAMLAIGAYEPRWFMQQSHMNPAEAVQVFKDLDARHAMPIHFGTFQLTDEAIDDPVKDLKAVLEQHKINEDAFQILHPGQAWMVPK